MRSEGLIRREALLPGELLPDTPLGKHHGRIVKSEMHDGCQVVHVTLTDFRNVRLQLPVESVQPHLLPKPEPVPRQRWLPDKHPSTPETQAAHKPKKKQKCKSPEGIPLHGPELQDHLKHLRTACISTVFPPGTRLWAKTASDGKWPGVAWSLGLCKQRDIGALVLSYRPGMMLICFYGQHSVMWISEDKCERPPSSDASEGEADLLRHLRSWGRQHNKLNLVRLALDEMAGAYAEPEAEAARMTALYETYTAQQRIEVEVCGVCQDGGAQLQCGMCDRHFHPLCLRSPAVTEEYLPEARWECPCCFEVQSYEDPAIVAPAGVGDDDQEGVEEVERMGLTPDWLISAAVFQVFKLDRPTPQRPWIRNLLDPCTNSKVAPNIPAQVLYDKKDDGLKLSNSWAGMYILLNPDFRAQVQWRFVNRAIDEVESGAVPAVILVGRSSTDTAFFQRLRPYPRISLRRTSANFKDYTKSPPGFGITVFCLAKHHNRQIFADFVAAFEPYGEPSIPFDIELLKSDVFYQQLARSQAYAEEHSRDHWVQCSQCYKWRIIDFAAAAAIREQDEWSCAQLRPPHTNCETPLSRGELMGGHYAARNGNTDGADGDIEEYRGQAAFNDQSKAAAKLTTSSADVASTLAELQPPPSSALKTQPALNVIRTFIPPAAVFQAISMLPLKPLQMAATSRGPEGALLTALELARQARIAANRAYYQHIGAGNVDQGDHIKNSASLPCNHPAVLLAAREVARIAALQACAAQKEAAWQAYEHARRLKQQQEAPLLAALHAVRQGEVEAQQRWEAARRAADEILAELNRVVAVQQPAAQPNTI